MQMKVSNRQAVCDKLIELAKTDNDIVVLTSDSRGSAGLTPFANTYPDRIVETGIAEQNIVGIAAGLAKCGKKPVVASPAAFLSMRSAEQVKVDVAYSRSNVFLLGISGGISYGALGMSHHSVQDIALMRAIPGIDVIIPADRFESAGIVEEWMKNPRPAYVRIGRNPVEDVFNSENTGYSPGKATVLQNGKDAWIIATGETVKISQEAGKQLENEGYSIGVLDMHTLKPFDAEAVKKAADTAKLIVTLEEHSIYGGLGSAVSQITSSYKPIRVEVIAIPDEPAIAGNSSEVFAYYGITKERVMDLIKKAI